MTGVEVDSISLWLFGGVAQLTSEARTPGSAFRIAAAGPAVSVGLGGVGIGSAVALAAVGAPDATVAVLGWLGAVNLVLAVFNLLPGLPLDGGRILQSFLWWRSGDPLAATMKAATGGRVVGFGLMGVGAAELLIGGSYGGLWTALVGSMVGNTAVAERQSASLRRGLRGLPIARVMTPDPTIVASWSTVGDFVRGESMRLGRPAYPLRAWDGRLDGLLVTARLLSAPTQDAMLRDLAVPVDQVDIAAPGESIDVVLARLRPYGEGYVVVMDEGRIVGMVGPSELRAGVAALTAAEPIGRRADRRVDQTSTVRCLGCGACGTSQMPTWRPEALP